MSAQGADRHTVVVGNAQAGIRLDRLLAEAVPALSRSRIKALITAGCISLHERTIGDAAYRVKPGEVFILAVPEPEPAAPAAQAIALAVVYEDAHLIVVDKPAGLVVHPAAGNPDRTLVNALLAHCGTSLSGVGGERRPGIVHRLDKETSGLIVAAKDDPTHLGLAEQFAAHSIERAYKAVVWGALRPPGGTISGAIGRSAKDRKKMAVLDRGGRNAVTHYQTLQHYGAATGQTLASMIECRLETGRTHQIRVHMTYRGHAIIGDPVYGSGLDRLRRLAAARQSPLPITRQALHAYLLGFVHPISRQVLRFESALPRDMNALLDFLE